MRAWPHGACMACACRYVASVREMVTGEPEQAALGVQSYMNVDSDELRTQMNRGLAAIEAEFVALAQSAAPEGEAPWWASREIAEEACECMRYVLHARAGSSPALFANSPFPRDCDASGLREDRRTEAGDGMGLLDFCHLDDALAAALKPTRVAAITRLVAP